MFSTKSGAAKLSLIIIIGLIALKSAVAVITGSISVLAQAVDSFLDLFAVATTFFAISMATKPADEKHPFGHGKVENIAAVVQAVLIFVAGGAIIYSAVRRIISGATVELSEAGIGVMLISILASIFLSRHLMKVSQATDSLALEANARNIAVDVYSASGVLVGLVAIRLTGLNIIDPIIALAVALLILKTAYDVMKKSFGGLIDVKLPEAEENSIKKCIAIHKSEVVSFHKLRTRKVGHQRHVDLHLVIPKSTSVEEAHRLCDCLEQEIASSLEHTDVTIHVEPCDGKCEYCSLSPDRCQQEL